MVDTESGTLESIVVADLGRGSSRAYLLEQIGGAFRFVAKAARRPTSRSRSSPTGGSSCSTSSSG